MPGNTSVLRPVPDANEIVVVLNPYDEIALARDVLHPGAVDFGTIRLPPMEEENHRGCQARRIDGLVNEIAKGIVPLAAGRPERTALDDARAWIIAPTGTHERRLWRRRPSHHHC